MTSHQKQSRLYKRNVIPLAGSLKISLSVYKDEGSNATLTRLIVALLLSYGFYASVTYTTLIIATILLLMSGLLVSLGILADLISSNRRLVQESLFNIRKQIFDKKDS